PRSPPLGRRASASPRRRSTTRRRRSAASASAWRSMTPTSPPTPLGRPTPRAPVKDRGRSGSRPAIPSAAMTDVEVRQADITKLEVDAIANAANTELRHGGGVAGAIVRAGGSVVQDESDELSPIGLGEAVSTTAGEMPSKWVIHAATMELGGPTS